MCFLQLSQVEHAREPAVLQQQLADFISYPLSNMNTYEYCLWKERMQETDDTGVAPSPEPCGGGLLERLSHDVVGVDEAVGGSVWALTVKSMRQRVCEV